MAFGILIFAGLLLVGTSIAQIAPPSSGGGSGGGGINGSVAYGHFTWNASNFPAFWNEDGISGETLSVNQQDLSQSQRGIEKDNIIYNTIKKVFPYKVYSDKGLTVKNGLDASGSRVLSGGYYAKVGWLGKPYVAVNGQAYKLSEIVLEQNSTDFKNLNRNEAWNLGNGYNLTLIALDNRTSPWQAAFNLSNKSGTISGFIVEEGDVYTYVKNLAHESGAPFFVTFIDNISENSVRLKYTWLISDNVTIFNAADRFGIMEVRSANTDGFSLSNENSIILSRATMVNLLDGLCLVVNDTPTLEYYPMMSSELPLPIPLAVNINISGIPVIGHTTSNILKVEYTNFNSGDPYDISITAQNGTRVYYDSGTLTGTNPEIIPINWIPSVTGIHIIEVWGRGIIDSTPVSVYDSEVVPPVPELGTIVLVAAGILGLVSIRRRY